MKIKRRLKAYWQIVTCRRYTLKHLNHNIWIGGRTCEHGHKYLRIGCNTCDTGKWFWIEIVRDTEHLLHDLSVQEQDNRKAGRYRHISRIITQAIDTIETADKQP